MGPRRDAYEAARRRVGVQEQTFLQRTPNGDLVLLVFEGPDVAGTMAKLASSKDPFDEWMVQQSLEIHGFDLREIGEMPMPEPAPRRATGLIYRKAPLPEPNVRSVSGPGDHPLFAER